MNCPKCGANNIMGSSFCIKCGTNLNENITNSNLMNNESVNNFNNNINNNINGNMNMQNSNIQNNNQINQGMNQMAGNNNFDSNMNMQNSNMNGNTQYNSYNQNMQQSVNMNGNIAATASLSFIPYIIAVLLKPFRTFNEENSKLNDTKNSLILGIIVSVFMTLVSIVEKMVSVVRVTTGGIFTEAKTTWEWSNLKELNYFKLIGKDLLIYVGIIVGVALIFYLASLIAKKQTSYVKMIAITSTALIPFAIGCMILSPILSNLSVHVGAVISIISIVYTLVLFNEFMDYELKIEGNVKIYFNLICYSLILIICYFVLTKYIGSLFQDLG